MICLSLPGGGEEGEEGRTAVILAVVPLRIFAHKEFVRAICKEQPEPAWMATTTAAKCKAPLICQKEVLGYQLQQPAPALARERLKQKQSQKPSTKAVSKKEFSVFHIFVDFPSMVQVMR